MGYGTNYLSIAIDYLYKDKKNIIELVSSSIFDEWPRRVLGVFGYSGPSYEVSQPVVVILNVFDVELSIEFINTVGTIECK